MTTTPPDNSEWIDEVFYHTLPTYAIDDKYLAKAKAQIIAKLREARLEEIEQLEYVDWEALSPDGSGINELFDPCIDVYIANRKSELNSPQGEEAGTV